MKPILVDTGPLYAMADQDDAWHDRVLTFLKTARLHLVIPITVLPEACYLINTHLGPSAEVQFARSVQRGEVQIEFLKKDDLARTTDIMDKYSHAELGFVDASLVAVAERLRIRDVLTTDRRHFSVIRPRHCSAFTLRP
ncbi:MAG: PIN domain-containing protein [Nitrospiraceae bacterium]|nr:PIN domain-containing protein [Nitrospiraceae bacterium]